MADGIMTRYEESQDIQGVVMQTITYQATGEISPTDGARSYRKDQVDGIWTLTEEFVQDNAGSWSSDGSCSSEPLESHARYALQVSQKVKNLWSVWKRNPSDEFLNRAENQINGKPWTPSEEVTDTWFNEFYFFYSSGVESFLCPRLTARFTHLEDGPPDTVNLGKIDDKPTEMFGYFSGYWLLSGVRSQQEGNKWRNTYEYLGAGPSSYAANSGWEVKLYGSGQ